jgi:protein-S-isoprenylcysteine O-methyltransferase
MIRFPAFSAPIYAIVFSISFWCWILLEIWVFTRDRGKQKTGSRIGALWFVLALALGITLGFNMAAIAPMFGIQAHFAVYFVLGIVLAWAGLAFRFWSIQTLGSLFSTRLMIQEHHELITTGPYKYLRNPSYTGALITFIGFGLAAGNWLIVVVLLLTGLLTYAWRIRVEERMLLEAFGQAYEDYKKRTWALIPFVW